MAKKINTSSEETKALPLEKAVHVEFEDKENVNWDELKAKVKNDEEH